MKEELKNLQNEKLENVSSGNACDSPLDQKHIIRSDNDIIRSKHIIRSDNDIIRGKHIITSDNDIVV